MGAGTIVVVTVDSRPGVAVSLTMKLQLNDPGMSTLHLTVKSFDEVFAHLKRYNETYTAAYLSDDRGQLVLNAWREVGDRNWRLTYRSGV